MRLETERLFLRALTESDRTAYIDMCADPVVMRHFPAIRTAAEPHRAFDRFLAHQAARGFSFATAELRADGHFVGIVGVSGLPPELQAALPGHPEYQIGWLLFPAYWGQGLATEGARACRDDAWTRNGLDEIVAVAARRNTASRRVMEKIGMKHDPHCDYDHPMVPDGNPVRPQVLYRIRRPERI